jgi:hypothetical protein
MRTSSKNRTGEKHTTNEGYLITIIEHINVKNCTIQFEDGTIIKGRPYIDIRRGKIKNPYHKSLCGVGYFGEGDFKSTINKNKTKHYYTWTNMIKRCYIEESRQNQPTYSECSVIEEWHNFQVFAQWFEDNCIENFALDKDILQKGNKVYSPETCCFVPQEINNIFTKTNILRGELPIGVGKENGRYKASIKTKESSVKKNRYLGGYNTIEEAFQAYKTAKEDYLKEVADNYKNRITKETYNALCTYEVEITD